MSCSSQLEVRRAAGRRSRTIPGNVPPSIKMYFSHLLSSSLHHSTTSLSCPPLLPRQLIPLASHSKDSQGLTPLVMEPFSASSRGSDLTVRPISTPARLPSSELPSPAYCPSSHYVPSSRSEHSGEGQDLLDFSSNPSQTLMDDDDGPPSPPSGRSHPSLRSTSLPAPPPDNVPTRTAHFVTDQMSTRTVRPLPHPPSFTSAASPVTEHPSQSTFPLPERLLTPPPSFPSPTLTLTLVDSASLSVGAVEESDGEAPSLLQSDDTGSMVEDLDDEPSPTGCSYDTFPSPTSLPPLPPSQVGSTSPPDPSSAPSLRHFDLQGLLPGSPSPEAAKATLVEETAEVYEEGDLNEALSEVHLLIGSYGALREQVAITSGSVEETTERIMNAIRK